MANNSMKRIFFRAHGRVQGVNFRNFTEMKAREHNVTGWVMNTSNQKVEGEVQGAPEDIDKIVAAIKEGPHYAHVVKLETLEREAIVEGETSFVRKKTPY